MAHSKDYRTYLDGEIRAQLQYWFEQYDHVQLLNKLFASDYADAQPGSDWNEGLHFRALTERFNRVNYSNDDFWKQLDAVSSHLDRAEVLLGCLTLVYQITRELPILALLLADSNNCNLLRPLADTE